MDVGQTPAPDRCMEPSVAPRPEPSPPSGPRRAAPPSGSQPGHFRSLPSPSHMISRSGHHVRHHLFFFVDLIRFFKKEMRFENTQMSSEGHKLGADSDLQRKEADLPRARAPMSPRPEPRALDSYVRTYSQPRRSPRRLQPPHRPPPSPQSGMVVGGSASPRCSATRGEVAPRAATATEGLINRQKLIVWRLN